MGTEGKGCCCLGGGSCEMMMHRLRICVPPVCEVYKSYLGIHTILPALGVV